MLPRTRRFLGRGNFCQEADGRRRQGWKIICSRCPESKTVFSAGSRPMPPEVVIKKLTQAGWLVANKSSEDVCPACQSKTVESHVGLAKKTLKLAMSSSVADGNGKAMHYSELLALALQLPTPEKQELIKSLREALPKPTPRPRMPQEPAESDSEYQSWLDQQS